MKQIKERDPGSRQYEIPESPDANVGVSNWHIKIQTYLYNQEELIELSEKVKKRNAPNKAELRIKIKELERILTEQQAELARIQFEFVQARKDSIYYLLRTIFKRHKFYNVNIDVSSVPSIDGVAMLYTVRVTNKIDGQIWNNDIFPMIMQVLHSREFGFDAVPLTNGGSYFDIHLIDYIDDMESLVEDYGSR